MDVDTGLLDAGPRLDVVTADIATDCFRPGRFDLVHARFVLSHVPGRDEVLARAAASWLEPGGRLVVTDPSSRPRRRRTRRWAG